MKHSNWTIFLVGAFVLILSLADVAATKLIMVGDTVAAGSVFLFAFLFIVRDMLHRLHGADFVRRLIWIAASLNILMALYLWVVTRFPAPEWFGLGSAWDDIFAFAPSIVTASIVAAVVSQLVNTAVYQRLWDRGASLAVRVAGSNLVSVPVDSAIFVTLAFFALPPLFGATPLEFGELVGRIVGGQTQIKLLMALALTPIIYLVPALSRRT
jgi:queuosine precursor transporter